MDSHRIKLFVKAIGGVVSPRQNRKKWVIASCPFAPWKHKSGTDNSPSFGIKIRPTCVSNGHCFSCNWSGDLMDIVMGLRQRGAEIDYKEALQLIAQEEEEVELDIPDYEEEEEKQELVLWPEWYLDDFVEWGASIECTDYVMKKRGVSVVVADSLKLVYDKSAKRVCFPVRTWAGDLAGLHGRGIGMMSPGVSPYFMYGYEDRRNTIVWLGEHWLDPEMPVILTESVFDLARIYSVYPNVMCALSAGMSKAKVERVSGFMDYVSLFDDDNAGDISREQLDKYLGSPVTHIKPMGDAGETSKAVLAELLASYIPTLSI